MITCVMSELNTITDLADRFSEKVVAQKLSWFMNNKNVECIAS